MKTEKQQRMATYGFSTDDGKRMCGGVVQGV